MPAGTPGLNTLPGYYMIDGTKNGKIRKGSMNRYEGGSGTDMRLFAAVQPSPGFRTALAGLKERLREAGVTGKYREPDGLHLTLAFIGEWPENVTEYLPAVQKPFSITLSHPGIFRKRMCFGRGLKHRRQWNGWQSR